MADVPSVSPALLFATAALMALVAVACSVLWLVWTVPAWRGRLGAPAAAPRADALRGWAAGVGSALVSVGIAASALLAWYGVYATLTAL